MLYEVITLVTEGIITLAKVSEELKKINSAREISNSVAGKIIRMMLESDEINFISGTRVVITSYSIHYTKLYELNTNSTLPTKVWLMVLFVAVYIVIILKVLQKLLFRKKGKRNRNFFISGVLVNQENTNKQLMTS